MSTTNSRTGEIVVGVDGSAHSLDALRAARRFGEALGKPIRIVASWEWPFMYDPMATPDYSPEPGTRALAEQARAQVFGPDSDVPVDVVHGPAAETLVDESASADLLVVGSRGRGGFASLLLGSVGEQCATHAHCPVLIVRGTGPAAA